LVGNTPHYQVHVRADGTSYRVAVNVHLQVSHSELLFLDDRFLHPVGDGLPELPQGFTGLPSEPGGLALDFIRESSSTACSCMGFKRSAGLHILCHVR
jgi:uncharacterized protein YukJ